MVASRPSCERAPTPDPTPNVRGGENAGGAPTGAPTVPLSPNVGGRVPAGRRAGGSGASRAEARLSSSPHLALSFDVGGTFTDFILVDLATGQVVAEHKVPTDPDDPAASSLAG